MIAIEGIRKVRSGQVILDDLTASFAAGEVVCLLGLSGSGKTTLLRCLNGLEPLDAGVVRVGELTLQAGARGAQRRVLPALRQRLGFVFQQWHLFANRTALGNVMEGPLHVRRVSRAAAAERARALLQRVGLGHREQAYPAELSGGEQQRVAIARALAMEPQALLLDEPTSALDPARVGELTALLRELAAAGLTLVIATHDMAFTRALASRVLVLHAGRFVEEGPPARVLEQPAHPRTRELLGT